MIYDIYTPEKVTEKAKVLFKHERAKDRLDGWFIAKEKELRIYDSLAEYDEEVKKALIIKEIVKDIPIDLDENQIFAGTQDDSFARSYALINPSLRVEASAAN